HSWISDLKTSFRMYPFKPSYQRKNNHRAFWSEPIQPLVNEIGPSFQRTALIGSVNGLTPEVTRKFYALLKLIPHLDADEAANLVDLCWRISAMDPYLHIFPSPGG